jgi:hypothetical protein
MTLIREPEQAAALNRPARKSSISCCSRSAMLAGVLWRFASCLPSSISTVWSGRQWVGEHLVGVKCRLAHLI